MPKVNVMFQLAKGREAIEYNPTASCLPFNTFGRDELSKKEDFSPVLMLPYRAAQGLQTGLEGSPGILALPLRSPGKFHV